VIRDWQQTRGYSLPDGHVDALSWIAVLAETAGALVFGVVGAWALRLGARGGAVEKAPKPRESVK
jgi:hypothetical protein